MTKTFIRGNERIEQIMRQAGMAEAIAKIEAEVKHLNLDQPFDTGDFTGYAVEHRRDSL